MPDRQPHRQRNDHTHTIRTIRRENFGPINYFSQCLKVTVLCLIYYTNLHVKFCLFGNFPKFIHNSFDVNDVDEQ